MFYYLLISRTKLLNEDILKLRNTSKEVSVGNFLTLIVGTLTSSLCLRVQNLP